MKKKATCLLMIIIIMTLLVGCQEKLKSEQELLEDLRGRPNIYLVEGSEITDLSVVKRLTNEAEKTDKVYVSVGIDHPAATAQTAFVMNYTCYNEGWMLDSVEPYDGMDAEQTVKPKQAPTSEFIQTLLVNASNYALDQQYAEWTEEYYPSNQYPRVYYFEDGKYAIRVFEGDFSSTQQYDCKVEIERVFDYVITKETRLMHFQFNPFVYQWELLGEDILDIKGHWYLEGQWCTNRQGETITFTLESQDTQITNASETFSGLWQYGDDVEQFLVEVPLPRPNQMPTGNAYIEDDFNRNTGISFEIRPTIVWCWDHRWHYYGNSEVFPDQLRSFPEDLQETGLIDMTTEFAAEDYQNGTDDLLPTEDAEKRPDNQVVFDFAEATDEELIQKYTNLITQILYSSENVKDANILASDSAYIYYPEYDESRCWNTIDLVQINGQWLFDEGLYLSAVGFEDRVIIYLCTNAGSSDIGWIYNWDGELIRDYDGQRLPDYIMGSVYGNSSASSNSSVDRLGLAVGAFLDCISSGNEDGIKAILPPRMDELAAMEGISEEEFIQQFLTMCLEDCPIWGESVVSCHEEKLSVENAEMLVDTEMLVFYSAQNAGISIVNEVTEQGSDCWITTLWIEVDDSWYLTGSYWFDSLDAIPIQIRQ